MNIFTFAFDVIASVRSIQAMESGIVLILRMISVLSARFVFKDFLITYYFCTYLFRRVFLLILLVSQRNISSISNCPLTSFRFVMLMEIMYLVLLC